MDTRNHEDIAVTAGPAFIRDSFAKRSEGSVIRKEIS
jgi:hypothetical protein